MTILQSLETLRPYVRYLEHINDNTYANDPVSGEVKLANPYADLIDAMHTVIDCMEHYTTRPTGAPDPRTDSSMTMQESIEVLRSYLRHSEKVHTEPRPFVSPDGTVEFCVINAEEDTLYQAVNRVFPLLEKAAELSGASGD